MEKTIDLEKLYNELKTIKIDIEFIKENIVNNSLVQENELTDWAKKELAKARKVPDSELISMEEIEKEFLS